MVTTIRINGRNIPASRYIAGIELAKTFPDRIFATSLNGWWPASGTEILRQYHDDLQTRINRRGNISTSPGRVHPATWAKARTPRVILERQEIQTMNRNAQRKLRYRQREEPEPRI